MRVRVCSTRSSKLRVAYLELHTTLRYVQRESAPLALQINLKLLSGSHKIFLNMSYTKGAIIPLGGVMMMARHSGSSDIGCIWFSWNDS